MRISTPKDPLGLFLGQNIKAKRVCTVDYDDEGNRTLFFEGPLRFCSVTGVIKKALGKYVAGRVYGMDDYEPPHLRVSKYIWLYECRTSITSKPFLVHSDDIVC